MKLVLIVGGRVEGIGGGVGGGGGGGGVGINMVKYPVAGGQDLPSLTNVPQSGGHRHHNYILISCDTWSASPPLSA